MNKSGLMAQDKSYLFKKGKKRITGDRKVFSNNLGRRKINRIWRDGEEEKG